MTREQIIDYMKKIGVLKQGHFKLTSGLHSQQYMQCAAVFEQPKHAGVLVSVLKEKLPTKVDTVVAPAIGGICMGYELAASLGCRSIFAERQNSEMTLRRGFQLKAGEKVLIAEDVVTTGGSVKEVLEIVKVAGCELIGVACLVDRSNGKADFGIPFYSLLEMEVATYQPEACPLCQQGIGIDKPGSR
ncbi:MAG TPA: orotate phosphoribosyltransferase [Bacillota bacterium]|nr:orotate phosphoribosyltransferase [Bacillota bacterium]